MPSEKAAVHIIDDDEALRESLAFLLRTAGSTSRATPPPVRFWRPAERDVELRDYRRAHAGHERHRPAAAAARNSTSMCRSSSSPATAMCRWRSRR